MNLTSLKSAAAAAKASNAELEIWQTEISPDDVLRLVEVARAAYHVVAHTANSIAVPVVVLTLEGAMEGIEL